MCTSEEVEFQFIVVLAARGDSAESLTAGAYGRNSTCRFNNKIK